MRTFRLALMGTAILALSGTVPAMAQEEPAPTVSQSTLGPPAWVIGTEYCSTLAPGSSTLDDDGVRHYEVGVVICTMEMSDPRVSGARTSTNWHGDMWEHPLGFELVQWMDMRIENDGGTWEGRLSGAASFPEHGDIIMGWYRGTGGYAGLSYFEQVTGFDPYRVEGLIFPGEPPALEPPAK